MTKTKVTIKCSFVTVAFCFVILAAFEGAAIAQTGLTKIADGVYSYVDSKDPSPAASFGANAGIIVGRDGIVVVDTLTSAKEAQRFIKDIRSTTDKPIKHVINTHHHLDHSLGNSEFVKLGAVVIAQENCRREAQKDADTIIKRALNYGFTSEALEGTTVALPTLTFTDRMEIDLGDRKIELIHAGPSHTGGSILVFVPDSKALFAGDVLFTDYHPNMRDGDIQGWVKALDRIASMDVASVIPGHGPLSTKKDVVDMKNYLLAFDAKVKELLGKSGDPEYIASEVKKALPGRRNFDMFIVSNVKALYLKK